jgi:hypothetical protein
MDKIRFKTDLQKAIYTLNIAKVTKILTDEVDVNERNDFGETALHIILYLDLWPPTDIPPPPSLDKIMNNGELPSPQSSTF